MADLITDLLTIGNNIYKIRKHTGMSRAEVAEAAGISERGYADIERGTVNMRIETFIKICSALHTTPDEIIIRKTENTEINETELTARLNACTDKNKINALKILDLFLQSADN